MSGTLNHALLINMVTDVAPALVARGRVSVHTYGADVMIRLNHEPLMSFHVDSAGSLADALRGVFHA